MIKHSWEFIKIKFSDNSSNLHEYKCLNCGCTTLSNIDPDHKDTIKININCKNFLLKSIMND